MRNFPLMTIALVIVAGLAGGFVGSRYSACEQTEVVAHSAPNPEAVEVKIAAKPEALIQAPEPVAAAAAAAPLPDVMLAITRVELIAVLSTYGLTVTDSTTADSDPWLSAKTPKGTEFYVNMYDCQGEGAENRRCNNLQFLAQWDLAKTTGLDSANVYNQKFVFGRAYLSKDGKMFMFDYSVNIKDGVTAANLKRHVDNWLRVLDDVRTHLKV
jgi:hypothetical protein